MIFGCIWVSLKLEHLTKKRREFQWRAMMINNDKPLGLGFRQTHVRWYILFPCYIDIIDTFHCSMDASSPIPCAVLLRLWATFLPKFRATWELRQRRTQISPWELRLPGTSKSLRRECDQWSRPGHPWEKHHVAWMPHECRMKAFWFTVLTWQDAKAKDADEKMPPAKDTKDANKAMGPMGPMGPMGSGISNGKFPFTPKIIRMDRCMARTWNGGKGGQCSRPKTAQSDFCTRHAENLKWQVHGRVDGHIPSKKIGEFERSKEILEVRKVSKKWSNAMSACPVVLKLPTCNWSLNWWRSAVCM